MPRWTLPLFTCLLAALPLAAEKSPAPDPWQTALAFDYNAAAERFAALHKASPADTRVAVAYASSLLVKQPRTEANIRSSRDLLLKVRETAPASDEDSILAPYLLARIELDHLDPAQPDSARTRLEHLRRDHPAHALADHAAVELSYLAAYPPAGPDVAAIPAIESFLASVKAPEASRDLHQLLGSLQLRQLGKPSAALPHFIAARAIGFEQPLRNAESDLTIANLARETGDTALARRHYAAFLASSPRDVRTSTVRRLLAGLDANPAPSGR
jgi:hypothetical protein